MAMGGYHSKGSNVGGQRERGRPYGLMLLLAFGAALLGLMALHKLRERYIHDVLLRDKDRELFSLHLLLQKEREYTKEMRKKAEEMRAKIYSLRTQKMELDSRILDMQSTISSLKEEQRTMELVLEEKQEEIKLLQEKQMDMGEIDLLGSTLREILKQKESEIAHLKEQLGSLNVSTSGSELRKEKMSKLEKREESGLPHEPLENSTVTRGAEETKGKLDVSGSTTLARKEKLEDQRNMTKEPSVQGEAAGEKNSSEGLGMNRGDSADSQDAQNSVDEGERNGLNVNGTANGAAGAVPAVEGKTELKKRKERETSEQPGNSSRHSGSTIQRKLGDGSGSMNKGKIWGALARDRRLESKISSAIMKHRSFIEDEIEITEEKQFRDSTAKEQDQDMNMKKTNEPNRIGSEDENDTEDLREADVEDSQESETEKAGSSFFEGQSLGEHKEEGKDEYKEETRV